jgi:hypothetical protein
MERSCVIHDVLGTTDAGGIVHVSNKYFCCDVHVDCLTSHDAGADAIASAQFVAMAISLHQVEGNECDLSWVEALIELERYDVLSPSDGEVVRFLWIVDPRTHDPSREDQVCDAANDFLAAHGICIGCEIVASNARVAELFENCLWQSRQDLQPPPPHEHESKPEPLRISSVASIPLSLPPVDADLVTCDPPDNIFMDPHTLVSYSVGRVLTYGTHEELAEMMKTVKNYGHLLPRRERQRQAMILAQRMGSMLDHMDTLEHE